MTLMSTVRILGKQTDGPADCVAIYLQIGGPDARVHAIHDAILAALKEWEVQ